MSRSIEIDQLADAVMGVLEEYRDVTVDVMKDAVDKTTKETVAEIRSDIPAAGIGGKGDYQKSWASKQDAESKKRYAYAKVVYAKDPHYRLTHLLEKGHDLIVRGSRWVASRRLSTSVRRRMMRRTSWRSISRVD